MHSQNTPHSTRQPSMYLQLKSTVLEDEKSLGSLYHVDDDI